jgi:hypothetical protein
LRGKRRHITKQIKLTVEVLIVAAVVVLLLVARKR